jgi:hypothetical protein
MRYITTILCTLAFLVAGISLAVQDNKDSQVFTHQTISAATVPSYSLPGLPLDLQLDLKKKYKETDTVYVTQPSDTVYVEKIRWVKSKHKAEHITARAALKRQGLDIPASEPDSVVRNKVCGDREEYTPDTIGPPKASIILIVDDKEVYKR